MPEASEAIQTSLKILDIPGSPRPRRGLAKTKIEIVGRSNRA
jgi:hypothetical protein